MAILRLRTEFRVRMSTFLDWASWDSRDARRIGSLGFFVSSAAASLTIVLIRRVLRRKRRLTAGVRLRC
jgi:hypothetical protein